MKYTYEDIKKAEVRFWLKVDKRSPDECWEWTAGFGRNGYGNFRISMSAGVIHAPTMALVLSKGMPPDGKETCHSCGNKKCCNSSHLYWGTRKQNVQDQMKHGTFRGSKNLPSVDDPRMDKSGENNGRSKLTRAQVEEIRAKYVPRKYGVVKLGKEYGVSASMISQIVRGESWT